MATAIGFIGFAVTCVNETLRVIEAVQTIRHAPQEIQELAFELKMSRDTLEDAKKFSENIKNSQNKQETVLVNYIEKMEEVAAKYKEIEDRIGHYAHKAHRLGWLWYKSSIRGETDKLKRYHASFSDMVQLLSANDVRDIKESFVTSLSSAIHQVEASMQEDSDERTFRYWVDKLSATTSNTTNSELRHLFESSPPSWVMETQAFRSWIHVSETSKWLWGIGEAGTGKTTTARYLADQLQSQLPSDELAYAILGLSKEDINPQMDQVSEIGKYGDRISTAQADSATAVFFFSYKSKSDASIEMVLYSLARQLIEQLHEANPHAAQEKISMIKNTLDSSTLERERISAKDLLESLLLDFARSYIVLDALDEYSGNWQELLGELNSINASVKFLVTSRGGNEDYMRTEALKRGELVFSAGENDEVIKKFVLAKLERTSQKLPSESFVSSYLIEAAAIPEKREEMAENIKRKADHNFLCATLHIRSLSNAQSSEDLELLLNTLPEGLNRVLADALARIKDQPAGQAEIGLLALQWAIYARQNLNFRELQHAIAASRYPNRTSLLDKLEEFNERSIMLATKRFLSIDKGKIIHIHKSIRDFCSDASKEHDYFPQCHSKMASVCLQYLNPYNFKGHCDTEKAWKDRTDQYSLLKYAGANWGYHLDKATEPQTPSENRQLRKLLKNEKFLELSAAALYDEWKDIGVWHQKVGWDVLKWEPGKAAPLQAIHILAYFDLGPILEDWVAEEKQQPTFDINHRTRLNPPNENGHTALRIASRMNNLGAVRVLLEHGADPLAASGARMFPTGAAAFQGHYKVVEALLDCDVTKAGEILRLGNFANIRPLTDAVSSGNEDTVRVILEKLEELPDATEIIRHQPNDLTALHEAAKRNLAHVTLILGRTMERETLHQKTKVWQDTALHIASHGGIETVKTLLFDLDADPNERQKEGQTPLHLAVKDEYARTGQISSILVDHPQTDIEAIDHEGRTILHVNAERGRPMHIDTIMRKAPRAHLTKKDKKGQTPIITALRARQNVWRGSVSHLLEISKPEELLLDDAREIYREALKLKEVYWMEQLLEKITDAPKNLPATPNNLLHDVVNSDSLPMLEMTWTKLKEENKDLLEIKDEGDKTPLVLAASLSKTEMVKFLVEAGADKNSQAAAGRTALHWALDNVNLDMVDYLLSTKVDYHLTDAMNMRALQRISADSPIRHNVRAREAQFGLASATISEREALHAYINKAHCVTGDENTRKRVIELNPNCPKEMFSVGSHRYLVTDPIPQHVKLPLSRIHVRIKGCDQGDSDHLKGHPGDRGKNFNGSNTWYDLALLRGDRIIHQYEWSRNLIGAEARWYESSWRIDSGHDNIGGNGGNNGVSKWTRERDREEARRFVREARHGDQIVVVARTQWYAWMCQIFEAEIKCYFRDWEIKHDQA